MPPEEVVGAIMFDPGADPVQTPVVVVDFCFKGFAAGKDMVPAIFVIVAIVHSEKAAECIRHGQES